MIVVFDKDYLRELYETGRVEFTVSETVVTVCNVLELSNHYQ